MKSLLILGMMATVVGCTGSGSEEAKAASELAPKPLTAEQKKQIESITKGAPAPGAHPGG